VNTVFIISDESQQPIQFLCVGLKIITVFFQNQVFFMNLLSFF